VPFNIGVNVHEIVCDSLPNQFQGLPQYYWNGWDDAATYLLTEKYELDRALKYEDSSIGMEKRYDNLLKKSQILEAMGRKDEAAAAKNEALVRATGRQLYYYGTTLQSQGKQDQDGVHRERKNAATLQWEPRRSADGDHRLVYDARS
jgi:hypothetical protein